MQIEMNGARMRSKKEEEEIDRVRMIVGKGADVVRVWGDILREASYL